MAVAPKQLVHQLAQTVARLIPASVSGLQDAGSELRQGNLVAFPTETVYGLGANAYNEEAVRNIFLTKGRPLTDPLIVHVSSTEDAFSILDLSPQNKLVFEYMAAKFWPGPLTMVAKAVSAIPLAGTGFVGVRVPSYPLARRLLQEAKVPVAAPSANRFGHVSPTTADHVLSDLGGFPISVLQDEESAPVKVGIESTVLKIDCDRGERALSDALASSPYARQLVLRVLKPEAAAVAAAGRNSAATSAEEATDGSLGGAGMCADLSEGAPDGFGSCHEAAPAPTSAVAVVETVGVATEEEAQEAPGQLLTHYAPDVDTRLLSLLASPSVAAAAALSGSLQLFDGDGGERGRNFGHFDGGSGGSGSGNPVLCSSVLLDFGGRAGILATRALAYRDLSQRSSMEEAANQLFDALRWAEMVEGAKTVLVADFSDHLSEHTPAVYDRIFRAASGKRVHMLLATDSTGTNF